MRRTRTIYAGRSLAYTHARARARIHTHTHARAEMYTRIFAFLIKRKRQHGDWSIVSTCACTAGGKGEREARGASYGEAKGIERDAGKSACTRTQQRQQRRQQQQQQRSIRR